MQPATHTPQTTRIRHAERRKGDHQSGTKRLQDIFTPETHKGLNPRTGTFYGRPVVATYAVKLELLDKYITALTTPLLDRIPGSLRDTEELLERLTKRAKNKNTKIATTDVIGLYPNIPWEEGSEAATGFYEESFGWLT